MCEFCTQHGDGKVWFKNAANYSRDLMADLNRRQYINKFFTSTIETGLITIGRLEGLYQKKKQLPPRIVKQIVDQAREQHFGQVVTIEDIREIVGKAATIVRIPCACRWAAAKKENRCCYSVSYTADTWYDNMDMGYFGLAHDEGLERVTVEEAIAQMEQLEQQHGTVHTIWTMITPFIGAICNCTPKDCLALRSLSINVETMFRGEQVAQVYTENCNGCGNCEDACQFGAINAYQNAGDFKAVVNARKCFGCGLCRNVCPSEALAMVDRRWVG